MKFKTNATHLRKHKLLLHPCFTPTLPMLEKRQTQVLLHILRDLLGVHGSMSVNLALLLCQDSWGSGVPITQDNSVSHFLFTCDLFVSYTEGLFSIPFSIFSCHSLLWISLGGIHFKKACQLCRYPPWEPHELVSLSTPHVLRSAVYLTIYPAYQSPLETWVRSSFWHVWALTTAHRVCNP